MAQGKRTFGYKLFEFSFLASTISHNRGAQLKLKIFLDDKSFHCLKKSIPKASRSHSIIENHLKFGTSNVVVSCDETEARNLLLYAGHCPGVIASIHEALRFAGLSPDPENGRE
jgi:hypothetical protein